MNRLRAALVSLTALIAVFLAAGCASPGSSNPVQLEKFVSEVQALEPKDFYLNAEYAFRSGFLTRSFSLGSEPLPRTKPQIIRLLRRWRVPHYVDGNIVVIQDPGLSIHVSRNPLNLTVPNIGRDKVGVETIAGTFDITIVGRSRMIQDSRPDPGENVTIEHASPLSLREALNHLTRKYHMEWTVSVVPADGLPSSHPRHVTMPDGTKALRLFPKGGLTIFAEKEANWHETIPAKGNGERDR
jgi:hypothetical protein